MLGRRVGRGVRIADLPRTGGDVDDPSAASRKHPRRHGPHAVIRPIQIHRDRPFPQLIVHGRERCAARDAGVVDQDIDRAKLLFRCLDGLVDLLS